MFTTTHDAILLVLAAMWLIPYLARLGLLISGRINSVPGAPLYIAVALVITAILW